MVLFIKNFNTCVTVSFAVDQAYDAYQRFGFTNCRLFRNPDSLMYATLISNLQAGYPAHLAVENPEGTAGHNMVVDGYRETDGKFLLWEDLCL